MVQKMCELVDPALRYMLVPKCQSGYLICNENCPKNTPKQPSVVFNATGNNNTVIGTVSGEMTINMK